MRILPTTYTLLYFSLLYIIWYFPSHTAAAAIAVLGTIYFVVLMRIDVPVSLSKLKLYYLEQ